MQMDRYVSSVSRLFVNNRLLKFVVIVLAGMQLMNYVSMREMRENQITVIVPMGLNEQVEVGGTFADEAYLNAMAVYVAQLLYSTTPVTVEAQTKNLLKLLTPEAYKTQSETYMLSSVSQAKNQVTQTSKIMGIKTQTEPETMIEVTLALDKFIFSEKVEETKQVRLRIKYEIRHGQFVITGLGEVSQ